MLLESCSLLLGACSINEGEAQVGEGDGLQRVAPAIHRPKAVACKGPPPLSVPFSVPVSGCRSDADCSDRQRGTDGRCVQRPWPNGYANDGLLDPGSHIYATMCTYDACRVDADCPGPGPQVCDCGAGASERHVCRAGSCRLDADCGPAAYCAPSRFKRDAGSTALTWHCTSPADECRSDVHCSSTTACEFVVSQKRRRCVPAVPPQVP